MKYLFSAVIIFLVAFYSFDCSKTIPLSVNVDFSNIAPHHGKLVLTGVSTGNIFSFDTNNGYQQTLNIPDSENYNVCMTIDIVQPDNCNYFLEDMVVGTTGGTSCQYNAMLEDDYTVAVNCR